MARLSSCPVDVLTRWLSSPLSEVMGPEEWRTLFPSPFTAEERVRIVALFRPLKAAIREQLAACTPDTPGAAYLDGLLEGLVESQRLIEGELFPPRVDLDVRGHLRGGGQPTNSRRKRAA